MGQPTAQRPEEVGDRNGVGQRGVPESDLGLLPTDMTGIDAIELGCGTAYISGWMARRGANVTGTDNSEEQLKTAARLATQHGIDLELMHGNAETVPKPDASYDFAISGAGQRGIFESAYEKPQAA